MQKDSIPVLNPEQFKNNYLIKGMDALCSSLNFNYFHVHKVESSCTHIKFPLPPYRNTVYECIILTDGFMLRGNGIDTVRVDNNCAFFLPAGQISTFESASDSIKGYYIHFSPQFLFNKYFSPALLESFEFFKITSSPVIAFDKKSLHQIISLIQRMEAELFNPDSVELIQGYLLTFLLELKQNYKSPIIKKIQPAQYLTDRFTELIYQYYKQNKSVAEYASILNVSPNHLNKSIKGVTGKSPSAMIDELIILEAKVLLNQTSLNISDIAYQLGMDDPSYFGRMFKKNTGLTPLEYRKKINTNIQAS